MADWVILFSLFCLFIKSTIDFGISNALLVFGFHWGFIFYYLFFKKVINFFNYKILFYFFSIITIIEGILVNTVLEAKNLPNYPADPAASHFSAIWQVL